MRADPHTDPAMVLFAMPGLARAALIPSLLAPGGATQHSILHPRQSMGVSRKHKTATRDGVAV